MGHDTIFSCFHNDGTCFALAQPNNILLFWVRPALIPLPVRLLATRRFLWIADHAKRALSGGAIPAGHALNYSSLSPNLNKARL